MRRHLSVLVSGVLLCALIASPARPACCYFSAKEKDVLQPAQKAFITWDPAEGVETFTVQPKFEGNAEDFGMVIPTPGRPRLDEMPRDFFKELAVFTILKDRKYPESKYFPMNPRPGAILYSAGPAGGMRSVRGSSVTVLESGVVGTLDYKIIAAERADDLYAWLKEHKYHYGGDEATLDHYVKKAWIFTVMKIDPKQMKHRPDGSYEGEVTPTRFQFASDRLVYPLRITKISVRDRTEALFYVQAPSKVDLPGEMTCQYQWVPMLQNAQGWYKKGIYPIDTLPGRGDEWLAAITGQAPALMAQGEALGYGFQSGVRPSPNKQGRTATTLEWAKRLTAQDIQLLQGLAPYSDVLPDIDAGIDGMAFGSDAKKRQEAEKIIRARLEQYKKDRPDGYLVREAPEKDVQDLRILLGHLQQGQFLTKIRKTFVPNEMDDDLLIVDAQLGGAKDSSEYEEILPTSPP